MSSLDSTFKSIHSIRKSLAFILCRLPLDMLNKIPEGHSNNIIWNAAHIIAVQQLLINRRSGTAYTEVKEITKNYRPGTYPVADLDQKSVDEIRSRLVENAQEMESMYRSGAFNQYEPFETRTKIRLDNIEDAINFELFHNGLHLGYIMSYMNALKK